MPRYRLELVRVDLCDAQYDGARYLGDPFATSDLGDFEAIGIRGDWVKTWAKVSALLTPAGPTIHSRSTQSVGPQR